MHQIRQPEIVVSDRLLHVRVSILNSCIRLPCQLVQLSNVLFVTEDIRIVWTSSCKTGDDFLLNHDLPLFYADVLHDE